MGACASCLCCGAAAQCIPKQCFAAQTARSNPNFEAVPEDPRFSAEWLSQALQQRGKLPAGASVTSLNIGEIILDMEGEELKNGGGLAGGQTVRVKEIEYGGNLSVEERARLPSSLIQKHIESDNVMKEAPSWKFRLAISFVYGSVRDSRNIMEGGMVREIETYRSLAAELPVRTPELYYAALDGYADGPDWAWVYRPRDSLCLRGVLLLEDLSTSGYSGCGHAVLDYKDGGLSGAVQEEAFRCMARIHGWGWGGRGMEPESGLEGLVMGKIWILGWAIIKPFAKDDKQLTQFLDIYSDNADWPLLQDPDVLAMLFDLRANTMNWVQRALDKDQRQTVLHGDFHRGNMFAKTKEDGTVELALFDFSFIGAGNCTWELLYFQVLGGGRLDAAEEARLLEVYHEALMVAKPDCGYSLQQLKIDYKLQLFTVIASQLNDMHKIDKTGEYEHVYEEHAVKPNIDGVGQKSTAQFLQHSIRRLVEYHKDQSSWDDYFSGAQPTAAYAERTPEEIAVAKAALQAAVEKNVAKRREGKAKADQEEEEKAQRAGGGKGGAGAGGAGMGESLLTNTP